jgi:hypothetical protein
LKNGRDGLGLYLPEYIQRGRGTVMYCIMVEKIASLKNCHVHLTITSDGFRVMQIPLNLYVLHHSTPMMLRKESVRF